MVLKNQKGQFVVEAVLLMIITMGLLLTFIRVFRENELLAKLVETPWERTAGMIETGNWGPATQTKKKVPYQHDRFYTPNAD